MDDQTGLALDDWLGWHLSRPGSLRSLVTIGSNQTLQQMCLGLLYMLQPARLLGSYSLLIA
jgi:hypothetical protein